MTLTVMALLCGLLLPVLRGNLSLEAMTITLAISLGVAAIVAVPWLLIRGRTLRHYLVRAAVAALLLTSIGVALVLVADSMGEEGIGLVVIVNIGGVFGFLIIIGSLILGLSRREH